jgi:hypothetical protein
LRETGFDLRSWHFETMRREAEPGTVSSKTW